MHVQIRDRSDTLDASVQAHLSQLERDLGMLLADQEETGGVSTRDL
jgi:hypothetical protein